MQQHRIQLFKLIGAIG